MKGIVGWKFALGASAVFFMIAFAALFLSVTFLLHDLPPRHFAGAALGAFLFFSAYGGALYGLSLLARRRFRSNVHPLF